MRTSKKYRATNSFACTLRQMKIVKSSQFLFVALSRKQDSDANTVGTLATSYHQEIKQWKKTQSMHSRKNFRNSIFWFRTQVLMQILAVPQKKDV